MRHSSHAVLAHGAGDIRERLQIDADAGVCSWAQGLMATNTLGIHSVGLKCSGILICSFRVT